jgi:hypothetical protein
MQQGMDGCGNRAKPEVTRDAEEVAAAVLGTLAAGTRAGQAWIACLGHENVY